MRVLYLYKDYAPVVGGIENHIRTLAEGLRQRGVDTRVLVTNTGPHTVEEIIGGVPVVKTARLLNVSSAPVSLAFYPRLRRLEEGVDIAHAHLPYPPGEIGQLLLGRSRRFVLTYHSDIVRQRVLGALYAPILWQVLKRADGITVSNPAYIRSSKFLRRYAGKCRVIPFGIDLDRFAATDAVLAQAASLQRQHAAGRPLLLFVGRLRHYKGLDVLIRALPSIDARLLVIGIGPMEAEWRTLAQAVGVADKVVFLGERSDADVVAAYHAADLFVLPSTNRAETLGIVQIEAMACGTAVVCTELGTGTSFVNQDGVTGFVVPPNDPAALAAAVNRLLAEPALRRRLGAAGRQRAEDVFSQQAMLERMLVFYQETLEQ